MEYNKVKVTVCGKEYSLQTTESPEYVTSLAMQLDKKIDQILSVNETISLTTATVLVALEILDKNAKINSDIDNIRSQVKSYVEEASKARSELGKLRIEYESLKNQNELLKNDIELHNLKENLDK